MFVLLFLGSWLFFPKDMKYSFMAWSAFPLWEIEFFTSEGISAYLKNKHILWHLKNNLVCLSVPIFNERQWASDSWDVQKNHTINLRFIKAIRLEAWIPPKVTGTLGINNFAL